MKKLKLLTIKHVGLNFLNERTCVSRLMLYIRIFKVSRLKMVQCLIFQLQCKGDAHSVETTSSFEF